MLFSFCCVQFIMRYFNLKQHTEPKNMFIGKQTIDLVELTLSGALEITEEQAKQKPKWGSGNISVNENGEWNWMACNHDTSG